jgi:hypothetical protein
MVDSDTAENSVYATDDEAVLENADEIADSNSDQPGASAGHFIAEEEDDNSLYTTESRYPSRTRRHPGTWWALQANSKDSHLSQIHEPLIANAVKTCPIRKAIELDEPSLREALNSSNCDLWEAAIAVELESLREAGTWDVVEVPRGAKVFPSKFLIKVKRNSHGTFERRKAQLFLREISSVRVSTFTTRMRQYPTLWWCISCLQQHVRSTGSCIIWM